jgi:hypothetical protein
MGYRQVGLSHPRSDEKGNYVPWDNPECTSRSRYACIRLVELNVPRLRNPAYVEIDIVGGGAFGSALQPAP